MKTLPASTIGLLLGLLSSILWGAVFVCGRYLVDGRGMDPMFVAALRFNIGAAVALAYMLATGRWRRLRAAAREWPLLIGLGTLGIFGMGTGVFMSVQHTSSINSGIICNANPIFIAVFALMIGERVPILRIVGLFIGLGGCAIISLSDLGELAGGDNDLIGCAFATMSAVCWAAYTVLGKGVSKRRGGLETATLALIAGGLMYVPVALARGGVHALDPSEWAIAAFLGFGPTGVAMLAWYKALEYVDANVLGPTQYVATLVGTLLGWLLLGEQIGVPFAMGGTAIIIGLWLATKPTPERASP